MKISTILWALWIIAVLVLLLFPIGNLAPDIGGFRHWDKIAHIGLFAVTGFMSVYGASFFSRFRNRMIFALVFSLALAVGSEFAQSLVSRDTSIYDLLADVIGIFIGLVFYVFLYNNKSIRSRFKL